MQNLFNFLKKNKLPALISGGVILGFLAAFKFYNSYKDNA